MEEAIIKLHLEQLPGGPFLATSDDLTGLVAEGRTTAETLEIAQDVARRLVESYEEHGDTLPPPLRGGVLPEDLAIPVAIS
jgi:antitoxin HicB